MTLTQTLQIEERYLQFEDLRAFAYCENRWQQDGCPIKRWELVNFIERMLQELKAGGIGYPAGLLIRKKEIQRRSFVLEDSGNTDAKEQVCSLCRGTGWQAIEQGQFPPSYSPCN